MVKKGRGMLPNSIKEAVRNAEKLFYDSLGMTRREFKNLGKFRGKRRKR